MLSQIRPAIVLLALFTLLTGLAYPLAITGIAQMVLPYQANGSLASNAAGQSVGSTLIGQNFVADKYFHSRPSATQAQDPPSRQLVKDHRRALQRGQFHGLKPRSDIAEAARSREGGRRRQARRRHDRAGPRRCRDDLGLRARPAFSPENALAQVAAVAKARNLPEDKVRGLVEAHIDGRFLGLIGEPRVNVLRLNMALDALTPS